MLAWLYLVTLLNDNPISVNARDKRIAERCIMVNRLNCKLGKATDLTRRNRNYERTFGAKYVIFQPYAFTDDIMIAERIVLQRVREYRIQGRSGCLNEWLVGIDPQQALTLALAVLDEANIEYTLPESIA